MPNLQIDSFPPEVAEQLQYYVYRLIDPRNGETFYIGKGKGNRVFAHACGDFERDSLSEKITRIRSINLAGFDVAHVIHRHGLSEKSAFEVEAALIDAYPGITNIVDGHGNSDFGAMHSSEIIKRYSAETARFQHKALLISVNRSALESSLYEATRYAWRLSKQKASQAEVVLATVQGLIVGVFVAKEWLEAIPENFPGKEGVEGRYGFVGHEAQLELQKLYKGKRTPDEFRKRGASNPIKYTW
ncbi:LEM-3-like GIY-YIG domain-containing protein [Marinomonas dokdonensis]|uniref:LEM-3-like GIY-YIG domain-containing protein n=1 Tax=Marinomonas dokdonensis TaxID=328224 RepID=UPI00405584EA